MSLLAGLQGKKVAVREDSVGAGRIPSGIYPFKTKMLYIDTNEKGTIFVAGELDVITDPEQPAKVSKQFVREYISFAGGEFERKDDKGDVKTMMGLDRINKLLMLTTGKSIGEHATETRMLEAVVNGTKKMVEREVLVDALGMCGQVCIVHAIVDQQTKQADGSYINNGLTREINEIEAFLDVGTLKTLSELTENKEAVYKDKFIEKYVTGKPYNKAKGIANGATKGAPTGAAAGGKPNPASASLF